MANLFLEGVAGGVALVLLLLVWGYGGAFVLSYGIPLLCFASLWLLRCFGLGILHFVQLLQGAARVSQHLGTPAEDEDEDTHNHRQDDHTTDDPYDDESAVMNAYGAALALLGLSDPVTRPALQRAYRRAIVMAHPDHGGTVQDAQAINVARDIIRAANGWA